MADNTQRERIQEGDGSWSRNGNTVQQQTANQENVIGSSQGPRGAGMLADTTQSAKGCRPVPMNNFSEHPKNQKWCTSRPSDACTSTAHQISAHVDSHPNGKPRDMSSSSYAVRESGGPCNGPSAQSSKSYRQSRTNQKPYFTYHHSNETRRAYKENKKRNALNQTFTNTQFYLSNTGQEQGTSSSAGSSSQANTLPHHHLENSGPSANSGTSEVLHNGRQAMQNVPNQATIQLPTYSLSSKLKANLRFCPPGGSMDLWLKSTGGCQPLFLTEHERASLVIGSVPPTDVASDQGSSSPDSRQQLDTKAEQLENNTGIYGAAILALQHALSSEFLDIYQKIKKVEQVLDTNVVEKLLKESYFNDKRVCLMVCAALDVLIDEEKSEYPRRVVNDLLEILAMGFTKMKTLFAVDFYVRQVETRRFARIWEV